jgi:MarR family transcriptional regulator, organic hydroperoxide resistance regulator
LPMSEKSKLVSDIIDNIRRVFQAVNEYSKKAERETGLTGPQLWAIKVIAEGAPIKVSEIARRMYLHPATVVGILDRLEGRELVTRTRSREDRRVVEIEMTDQGRDLLTRSPEVAQGLLVKGLETLSTEKLGRLDEELLLLVKILGAQEIPPKLLLSSEVNLPKEKESKSAARIGPRATTRKKVLK